MLGQLLITAMISPSKCIMLGLILLGIAIAILIFIWPELPQCRNFFFKIERGARSSRNAPDIAIGRLFGSFIGLGLGGITCIVIGLVRML